MTKNMVVALYVLVMILLIVGVDVLFLRHLFWQRLFTNISIVVVFGAVYMLFVKNSGQ